MSIKLTTEINGKRVVLDLISLGGTTVRRESLEEMKKEGITEQDLKDAGYGVEVTAVELEG